MAKNANVSIAEQIQAQVVPPSPEQETALAGIRERIRRVASMADLLLEEAQDTAAEIEALTGGEFAGDRVEPALRRILQGDTKARVSLVDMLAWSFLRVRDLVIDPESSLSLGDNLRAVAEADGIADYAETIQDELHRAEENKLRLALAETLNEKGRAGASGPSAALRKLVETLAETVIVEPTPAEKKALAKARTLIGRARAELTTAWTYCDAATQLRHDALAALPTGDEAAGNVSSDMVPYLHPINYARLQLGGELDRAWLTEESRDLERIERELVPANIRTATVTALANEVTANMTSRAGEINFRPILLFLHEISAWMDARPDRYPRSARQVMGEMAEEQLNKALPEARNRRTKLSRRRGTKR